MEGGSGILTVCPQPYAPPSTLPTTQASFTLTHAQSHSVLVTNDHTDSGTHALRATLSTQSQRVTISATRNRRGSQSQRLSLRGSHAGTLNLRNSLLRHQQPESLSLSISVYLTRTCHLSPKLRPAPRCPVTVNPPTGCWRRRL